MPNIVISDTPNSDNMSVRIDTLLDCSCIQVTSFNRNETKAVS